jgi:hypothetical protein
MSTTPQTTCSIRPGATGVLSRTRLGPILEHSEDECWCKALFRFLRRLRFCNASQRSPPCIPSSRTASFYRKLGECGWTHHSAGASRSRGRPVGRNDEEFPRGVARLSGRPKPLAHARLGWRSSTVLNHELQDAARPPGDAAIAASFNR